MKEQRKFERKFGKIEKPVEEIEKIEDEIIEEIQPQEISKPKIKRSKMEY